MLEGIAKQAEAYATHFSLETIYGTTLELEYSHSESGGE